VYLHTGAIALWIFNALLYATIICLLFYYSVQKSFEEYSIFEFGTTVFVGTCNCLQLKVAFLHHQWSALQAFIMLISVGGMLAYLAIISKFPINLYEYYNTGYQLLSESELFWFFGFFSVPVFVIFIDVLGYDAYYFFWPSKEMMYREIELKVILLYFVLFVVSRIHGLNHPARDNCLMSSDCA
jgi:Phospholipid-translocating P-type ATPase C-terminal